ncbi:MAG: spore cortex-lytic enzyme [Clostridiales bacterium]|jgi:N-acetylmuramoyl-L-alanine amidase|nr:spore cortex-lytic enzyme [Clostridiales bacterium]
MNHKLKYIWSIVIVVLVNILVIAMVTHLGGSVQTLSKMGSQGTEVKQIQVKLRDMGYYKGNVDSIFGTQTKNAVIQFQRAKGLTPDGIAGAKTLKALGLGYAAGGQGGFSSTDVALLARVTSAESRGEPYTGQVAVAAVILNRVEHPSFPNTLAGVIYQPGAFSCLNDGGINAAVEDSSYKAARDAINGWDPSGGAIYYYNPAKSTSKWIFSRPVITVIGDHRFCS